MRSNNMRKTMERVFDAVARSGRNGLITADIADLVGTSYQYTHYLLTKLVAEKRVEKFRDARRDEYGIVRTALYFREQTE